MNQKKRRFNYLKRASLLAALVAVLASGAGALGVAPLPASDTFTIVDTLGAATPATKFDLGPADGWTISTSQFVGPRFTLTERTVITEIGGFIAGGVFSPPGQARLVVQLRPAVSGNPDPVTLLGTFVLSSDNDPFVTSYESVAPDFTLEAGTYFALFAQPAGSLGSHFLLAHASRPFAYTAGATPLGALCGGVPCPLSGLPGAVRILGRLAGDTTPPVLRTDVDLEVDAIGPAGAPVTYVATATDDTDPNPTVSCDPPSGSTFPIGTTTVSCTATDSSGNSSRASFDVHVKGAAEQLADLAIAVSGIGPGMSLVGKVTQAQAYVAQNDVQEACSTLDAFAQQVRAQSGKKLQTAEALALSAAAARAQSVLDC